MERDEEECSNTRCELYINKIEIKISLHRVSCEDHNHQGLTYIYYIYIITILHIYYHEFLNNISAKVVTMMTLYIINYVNIFRQKQVSGLPET